MRLLRPEKNTLLPADPQIRFFIQLWYGMTHVGSLDSHRVRCMNAYNSLREFHKTLSKTFISNLDKDLERIKEECHSILDKDEVVKKYYLEEWNKIKILISQCFDDKRKEANKKVPLSDLRTYRIMNHYLENFIDKLREDYKNQVLSELRIAIFDTNNEGEIYNLTNSLLSKLLDEGFALDNLYSVARFIFIENRTNPTPTFEENFEFMVELFNRSPLPFKIIFRLENFKNQELIPETISGIEFKKTVEIADPTAKKLLNPGPKVLFAITEIKSQDARSAGYEARKIIEDILDLIRFELEEEFISTSDEFISVHGIKVKTFKLNPNIPNPNADTNADEFKKFVKFVINYLHLASNPVDIKEKIRSTLRFYRMGRDSNRVENKFLNWWTALEHLVRTGGTSGQGKIYEHTEEQTIPILVLNYLPKLLKSYRNSIDFCKVSPTTNTRTKYGVDKYSELNLVQFLESIQERGEIDHISANLSAYPALNHSFQIFCGNIVNGGAILDLLQRHEKNLQWHINRIWRARCDLVHSAEVEVSINLLCANLEYYLKTIFSYLVNAIIDEEKTLKMNEIYDLIFYKLESIKNELRQGQLHLLKGSILASYVK